LAFVSSETVCQKLQREGAEKRERGKISGHGNHERDHAGDPNLSRAKISKREENRD